MRSCKNLFRWRPLRSTDCFSSARSRSYGLCSYISS
ncbi:hypothetical protein EVA_11513 [gut metagenome]|uniref:Uncharacterized protein n=1 Tax=gut metagenome TaxID=749906 RepID=J9CJW5_9ZZZZ